MVLDLENRANVMKALYLEYGYLFFLVYSCGHNKQHQEGLNAESMSKLYGGKKKLPPMTQQ